MHTGIDLSIIILSYNTRELLKNCLISVAKCRQKDIKVETIVVDNNSKDGSCRMVQDDFPWVKLIKSPKNSGFAGGNNLGIKAARGRLILFLNSDVELYPNALEEAVSFMDTDDTIGVMTPKTLLFSGGMDPDCHRGFPTPWASLTYFLGLERLFPKSRLFGRYHKLYENLEESHEIDAGFGTFMVVKREVVEKIGGWDDTYFFYGEDLDYFYRIKNAGWRVMFYFKPLLLHHKGGSSGLRKESHNVTIADKETRIKAAKASIAAMEIFYKKFYKDKYPSLATALILSGIKIKGFFRVLFHSLG